MLLMRAPEWATTRDPNTGKHYVRSYATSTTPNTTAWYTKAAPTITANARTAIATATGHQIMAPTSTTTAPLQGKSSDTMGIRCYGSREDKTESLSPAQKPSTTQQQTHAKTLFSSIASCSLWLLTYVNMMHQYFTWTTSPLSSPPATLKTTRNSGTSICALISYVIV